MYKNTIYSFGAKAVAGICFFLLDILIARILGYGDYNEWSFYLSIATIIKYLDRFGVDTSTKVYLARSANDKKEQKEYFCAGFLLELILFIIIIFVEFAVAYPLCRILGYPDKYPNLLRLFLSGIVFTSAYSIICFFKDASVGLLKFKNLFTITVIEFTSYLICAYIGMTAGGIIGLGFGHSAALVISIMFCIFLYKDNIVYIRRGKYDKHKMKAIIKYAISLIFVNMGGLVLTEMDTFMLGLFSHGQVGIYAIPKNLLDKAVNIPLAICLGAVPSYAIIEKNSYIQQKSGYFKLLLQYCMLLIAIASVLALGGKTAVFLLYGDRYSDSVTILYWLIPYFLILSLTSFFSSFLSYQKRDHELMVSHSVMIASNIIFNILLIPKYGALGAAIATDISLVIFLIFLLVYHIKYFNKLQQAYGNNNTT